MKKRILALILACSLAATGSAVLQPVNVYAAEATSPDYINDHLTYAKSRSLTAAQCDVFGVGATIKTKDEVTLTIKTKNGKKTKLGLAAVNYETGKQKVVVKAKKRSKLTYTFTPEAGEFVYFSTIIDSKMKKYKVTIKSTNKKAIIGNDFSIE